MSSFQKATKKQAKLRMCIEGLSGSGKTFTALSIAKHFGRVAVIDTERGSASKYADEFDFDVLELESFSPDDYIRAMIDAHNAGCYDVLVIDSLSHAWAGKDGALEQVDNAKSRSQSGNSFAAWKDVTPKWNKLIDVITRIPLHVIGTLRQKTEYVIEVNDKGRQAPKKVGLAPIFREGSEYEFDVVSVMDREHHFIVEKSRCRSLQDKVFFKPEGKEIADELLAWLGSGEAATKTVKTDKEVVYETEEIQRSKAVGRRLKETGVNMDTFNMYMKAAWKLDTLKNGLNEAEYNGIMLALSKDTKEEIEEYLEFVIETEVESETEVEP